MHIPDILGDIFQRALAMEHSGFLMTSANSAGVRRHQPLVTEVRHADTCSVSRLPSHTPSVLGLVTLVPHSNKMVSDLGYHTLCPFAPWSTLTLLFLGWLAWIVRGYVNSQEK